MLLLTKIQFKKLPWEKNRVDILELTGTKNDESPRLKDRRKSVRHQNPPPIPNGYCGSHAPSLVQEVTHSKKVELKHPLSV